MGYQLNFKEKEEIFAHLRADAILRPLIDEFDFPEDRIQLNEVYPSLLRSIIGQQVSVAAANSIYKKFLKLFDINFDNSSAQVPTPHQIIDCEHYILRSAGLSNSKAIYVKELAKFFKENPNFSDLVDKLTDQEIIDQLTLIKGVGQWTVEMMLIFALGRKDVFPIDDLAIKQSVIELYQVEESGRALKKKLLEIGKHWTPYRSIASLYLYQWRGAQKRKKQTFL